MKTKIMPVNTKAIKRRLKSIGSTKKLPSHGMIGLPNAQSVGAAGYSELCHVVWNFVDLSNSKEQIAFSSRQWENFNDYNYQIEVVQSFNLI